MTTSNNHPATIGDAIAALDAETLALTAQLQLDDIELLASSNGKGKGRENDLNDAQRLSREIASTIAQVASDRRLASHLERGGPQRPQARTENQDTIQRISPGHGIASCPPKSSSQALSAECVDSQSISIVDPAKISRNRKSSSSASEQAESSSTAARRRTDITESGPQVSISTPHSTSANSHAFMNTANHVC